MVDKGTIFVGTQFSFFFRLIKSQKCRICVVCRRFVFVHSRVLPVCWLSFGSRITDAFDTSEKWQSTRRHIFFLSRSPRLYDYLIAFKWFCSNLKCIRTISSTFLANAEAYVCYTQTVTNDNHLHKLISSVESIRQFTDINLNELYRNTKCCSGSMCIRSSVTTNRQRLTHAHAQQFYLSVATNSYCAQQCRLCSLTQAHGRTQNCVPVCACETYLQFVRPYMRSAAITQRGHSNFTPHTQHVLTESKAMSKKKNVCWPLA